LTAFGAVVSIVGLVDLTWVQVSLDGSFPEGEV
jgi:hypothetical protein